MPTTRDPDEISVLIDEKEFRFWSEIEVTQSMDAFSTASFKAPFEPDSSEFRETFRPFTFKPLQILMGGEPLFTGTLVDIEPSSDANSTSVNVTAYSLPGVLVDCTMPATAIPIEYRNIDFRTMLAAIVAPFGLETELLTNDFGPPFEKVALGVGDKPLEVLADLVKQRGLLLTNTQKGAVLCWRPSAPGSPVARLSGLPIASVEGSLNSREYFSEITGFAPANRKKEGSKYTGKNPWLSRIRPMSFKLDDTEKADVPLAVAAKLGRMFANMASYTVKDLPTWRDPQGKLWQYNTTVTLLAPRVMVYRDTELLIREFTLKRDANQKTATLNLVLPGTFSGEVPSSLPWLEESETTTAQPNNGDPLPAFLGQP